MSAQGMQTTVILTKIAEAMALDYTSKSFAIGPNLKVLAHELAAATLVPLDASLRKAVEAMVVMMENGEWAEMAAHFNAPRDELAARLEDCITGLHNNLTDAESQNCAASVASIKFALETDEGLAFLKYWHDGDFDDCRRVWPEAPAECYIGADPLFKPEVEERSAADPEGTHSTDAVSLHDQLCTELGMRTESTDDELMDALVARRVKSAKDLRKAFASKEPK